MLKHKKLLSLLLAATMLFTVTGCGGGTDDGGAAGDTGESGLTEWEETANIYATDETDEELYEQAIAEGGEVTLYSISSRCGKVAEAFMAKYPEIECTAFDISTNELLEKVTREHEAGQYVADVVHIKDQDGSLYNEYVQNKIFYLYQPADIFSHIDPSYTETGTPLYIELTQLFYNAEAYPDGSPITNIWQLTEPQWKGKILMQNPLDNLSWGSWITGFCVGDVPDQLAAAKLLIRFMMGGIDGDTSGYAPFNTLGGWPVRDDIEPAEGSTPYSELNVSPFDPDEIYVTYNTVRDFWQMLG